MGGIAKRGALALVVIAVACSAPEKQEGALEETGKTASALITAHYEAENMTWSGTEGVDGEVDPGPPVTRYFWSDSSISQNHPFVGGSTTITVRARGELLGGVGPHVVVSVAGTTIGSTFVNETSFTNRTFTFNATAGTKAIRVQFDNDDANATEDRNLLVDWVEVDEPGSPPTCTDTTYEGESMPWSGTEGVDGEVDPGPPVSRYFWKNGYIYKNHIFATGPMRIRVRARGELYQNIGPHMVISIGGGSTLGSTYVGSTGFTDYTFDYTAPGGGQEITSSPAT